MHQPEISVDYPIKTLSQLKPILQGFRKTAGLTQAGMASHLGVTQQTYAQLEANPAAVSVDRLFRVLRVLQVDLTLVPRTAGSAENNAAQEHAVVSASNTQAARKTKGTRAAKQESTAAPRNAKDKAKAPRDRNIAPAKPARTGKTAVKTTPVTPATTATARKTTTPRIAGKKREDW